jgi:Peptidylarginine deiminase and related enzymes
MNPDFTGEYILPAEWKTHKATWLGWPHNEKDWPGKFSPIKWVFAEMIRKISEGEIIKIIIESENHIDKAKQVLVSAGVEPGKIEFHIHETNRGWLRDAGPAFVKRNDVIALIDFRFNGWAKYKNHKKDDTIPSLIAEKTGYKLFPGIYNDRHVVLEGGAIDINGKGTLITTEECILDNNTQVRNPDFTKSDYESLFRKYLGTTNVIWLGKGIEGDDTHGHVDDLCRFVNERTLLLVTADKPSQPRYKELNENRERLQDAYLEDGTKPEVIELLYGS